jgi:hypothetical protein
MPDQRSAVLVDALKFRTWGWTLARCEHPRPHGRGADGSMALQGAHWYIRPNKGRPPKACFTVSATARTARYRKNHPGQKLRRRD